MSVRDSAVAAKTVDSTTAPRLRAPGEPRTPRLRPAPAVPMSISVLGVGYVGAVSLACLARDGHRLVGVDIDANKLAALQAGRSPIVEEGIQELTREVIESERVMVTPEVRVAIENSDVSFVCVGTPASSNGNQDLTAIRRVSEQIGEALRDKATPHVVVVRSTVRPGTVDEVITPTLEQHSVKTAGREFSVCFQPEFLREGSSIRDYDNPPFTVVGAEIVVAGLKTPAVVDVLERSLHEGQYIIDLAELPDACRSRATYQGVCW